LDAAFELEEAARHLREAFRRLKPLLDNQVAQQKKQKRVFR